jgi:ubiquinone/menaquinone biosynthesis C-methylase UbiE
MTEAKPAASCSGTARGASKPSWRDQFAQPHGVLGWAVGHLLALKNAERSEFVVPLLGVRETDRVIEIGFGPGTDIRRIAATARFVAGVDPSAEMLRQASRRNETAIREGRVALREGTADALPFEDESFDVAFSINTVQFWRDLEAGLNELLRVLRPGGLLAIAIQPRNRGATEDIVAQWRQRLEKAFDAAGMSDIRAERRPMRPRSTVCVLGRKAG